MTPQIIGDLLVGFTLQIIHQHLPFQRTQYLAHLILNIAEFLAADDQLLRVGHLIAGDDIQQSAVGILIIYRLVQADIRIQRYMLLSGGRFDRGDDLPGDAQLGKRPKRRELITAEIPDGLIHTDHTLLDQVLLIAAQQKISPRLGTHIVFVFIDEILLCINITGSGNIDDFLIGHILIFRQMRSVNAQLHHISPLYASIIPNQTKAVNPPTPNHTPQIIPKSPPAAARAMPQNFSVCLFPYASLYAKKIAPKKGSPAKGSPPSSSVNFCLLPAVC